MNDRLSGSVARAIERLYYRPAVRRVTIILSLGLISACADPVEELRAELKSYLASESKDLSLGTDRVVTLTGSDAVMDIEVLTFVRGPVPERSGRLLHLKREEKGWRVARDLVGDFAREADRATFKDSLLERMGKHLSAKFERPVKVVPPFPQSLKVEASGKVVLGTIQILYTLTIPGERPRKIGIAYLEIHRYDPANGWVFDHFSIHEQVPR